MLVVWVAPARSTRTPPDLVMIQRSPLGVHSKLVSSKILPIRTVSWNPGGRVVALRLPHARRQIDAVSHRRLFLMPSKYIEATGGCHRTGAKHEIGRPVIARPARGSSAFSRKGRHRDLVDPAPRVRSC